MADNKFQKLLGKLRTDRKFLLIVSAVAALALFAGTLATMRLMEDAPVAPVVTDENNDGKLDELDEAQEQEAEDSHTGEVPAKPSGSGKPEIYDMRLDNRYLHDFPGETFGISIPPGKSQVTVQFEIYSKNLDISKCAIVEDITHDFPNDKKEKVTLKSVALQDVVLYDGYNTITVTCPANQETIIKTMKVPLTDRLPEACRGFSFSESAITVNTYEELKAGMLGTWTGCVTTPWIPMYHVTIEFRADGTYSAVSNEVLDFAEMNAMYYGSEQDNPNKKYEVKNLNGDKTGEGQIDITWDATSTHTSRGSLQNIKLMGNKLSFEFFHFNQYGPVKFQLTRQ